MINELGRILFVFLIFAFACDRHDADVNDDQNLACVYENKVQDFDSLTLKVNKYDNNNLVFLSLHSHDFESETQYRLCDPTVVDQIEPFKIIYASGREYAKEGKTFLELEHVTLLENCLIPIDTVISSFDLLGTWAIREIRIDDERFIPPCEYLNPNLHFNLNEDSNLNFSAGMGGMSLSGGIMKMNADTLTTLEVTQTLHVFPTLAGITFQNAFCKLFDNCSVNQSVVYQIENNYMKIKSLSNGGVIVLARQTF